MPFIHNDIKDYGLSRIGNTQTVHICSAEPSSFANVSAVSLGYKSTPTISSPTSGLNVRVVSISPATDGIATASGTGLYAVFVDSMVHLYVNIDATSNGDGSQASPYNTVASALVSANYPTTRANNVVIHFSGAASHTSCITLSASMTSSSYHLYLVGNRTARTWDTSAFKVVVDADRRDAFSIEGGYVHLDKMQVHVLCSTANSFAPLGVEIQGAGSTWISNCIFRGHGSLNGQQYHSAIEQNYDNSSSPGNTYVWNNIIYDFIGASGINAGIWNHRSSYLYATNNTVYNCGVGIQSGSSSGRTCARNNVVAACTDRNYVVDSAFMSSTNNTSSDATRPLTDTTNLISQTITFVDAANRDFGLAASDTSCIDNGLSMSGDTYTPFTTDIIGTSRPQGSGWDRGAVERI